MISTIELLEELFIARLAVLSVENGLTEAETERIIAVFKQAAASPFMTEQHICQLLAGEDGRTCS